MVRMDLNKRIDEAITQLKAFDNCYVKPEYCYTGDCKERMVYIAGMGCLCYHQVLPYVIDLLKYRNVTCLKWMDNGRE